MTFYEELMENEKAEKWLMSTPLVRDGFKPMSVQVAESLKTEKNCEKCLHSLVCKYVECEMIRCQHFREKDNG